MKPELTATAEHIRLALGNCKARLTADQANNLRDQLASQLRLYLEQPSSEVKKNQKKLSRLEPLAQALAQLESRQLQSLLLTYPKHHLVALIRYARAQLPGVSEQIFAQLSKRAADQVSEELALRGPVPLHQLLPALEALEGPLSKEGLLFGTQLKARDYLQRLAQLPANRLKQLLQKLPPKAVEQLLAIAQQLDTPEIAAFCKEALKPGAQPPASKLDENQIRLVMALVSRELKKLKESDRWSSSHA
ncbi:FliG C-terminal domain-containing protein [Marinospirillum celere]|uniref:FliG C-terminal domain-containing protein n=1 Tax=Marinospirillum celere TaxID=1122252 RepID=A0A1I1H5Y4_9GAMM|nr:FliG C-terminal domain-containing protein [Marinospirillum celere]SFC19166.1 FliG C-terminal domain-containing protein [Marinospirillum celere]